MVSLPIPQEILGQFRVFRSALNAEIFTVLAAQRVAQQQLRYLASRRRLTAWAQLDIVRRWQATGEANRIRFVGPVEGRHGEIIIADVRPSPSMVQFDRWSDDADARWEANVSLSVFGAAVARGNVPPANKVRLTQCSLGTASAHALCRRVQRGGGTMMQAARDMQEILQWGRLAVETGPAPFIAPTRYGYWAGRMLSITEDGPDTITRDSYARTCISTDDTLSPALDEGVARLRRIGSAAPEARELMRDLAARRRSEWR